MIVISGYQKWVKRLHKPEYFYRPSLLWRRWQVSRLASSDGWNSLPLAWGSELKINSQQTIGSAISSYGIYDLALSEFMFRVIRPGDFVLDVGANVGYTSRLMADCLRGEGRLMSFEPLPELFQILSQNLKSSRETEIRLCELALSDQTGFAELTLPDAFEKNDGIATLENKSGGKKIRIKTSRLDDLKLEGKIRLMKMDVEGHELSVLKGSLETLNQNEVEYVLYEDLGTQTAEVESILKQHGYKVFKLVKHFTGLRLESPQFNYPYSYDPDNFVALKDLSIVDEINKKPEWKLLQWKKRTGQ